MVNNFLQSLPSNYFKDLTEDQYNGLDSAISNIETQLKRFLDLFLFQCLNRIGSTSKAGRFNFFCIFVIFLIKWILSGNKEKKCFWHAILFQLSWTLDRKVSLLKPNYFKKQSSLQTSLLTLGPKWQWSTQQHRQENRCLVPKFHNMKNQFWAVGCWSVK